ncbi:MAG: MFS transporter [Alphaproteobacteria bacterium]
MNPNIFKIVFLSSLGNALEFYDFTICAVFIPVLSAIYFPHVDQSLAIFAGLFTFGAGFIGRPFGAYLFGYVGDRWGRKKALSLTVGLMAVPTFIIAILPSYNQVGIIAPIILVCCRFFQGLCTGGEYNGAAIFAIEHDGGKHAGLVSGIIVGSAIIGALLANVAGSIVLKPDMPSWAWRIPFLIGGCIGLIAYIVRKNFQETSVFIKSQSEHKIQAIFSDRRVEFGLNIIYAFVTGVLFYIIFGFLNIYSSRFLNLSLAESSLYNTYGLTSFMLSCIIFGALSDRIGIKRALCLPVFLITALSGIVFFLLQQVHSHSSLVVGQILLGLLCGSYLGPGHAFMLTLFPPHERYTGTSLSFSIGMCIAGATTPAILTYLIDQTADFFVPAYYMTFFVIVIGIALYTFINFYDARRQRNFFDA